MEHVPALDVDRFVQGVDHKETRTNVVEEDESFTASGFRAWRALSLFSFARSLSSRTIDARCYAVTVRSLALLD